MENKTEDLSKIEARFAKIGVSIPEVLLPQKKINYKKWAVIACDQYSSELRYWQKVEKYIGKAISSLRLIFPEVFLESSDKNERIKRINSTMQEYRNKNLLRNIGKSFVLIERRTATEKKPRLGLILALDLDAYDFKANTKTLVRPTEGTIVERLPPRMEIRKAASLELPHIMVLIDDPKFSLIENLYAEKNNFEKLYDFRLMLGSGKIKAWKISSKDSLEKICTALESLVPSDKSSDSFLFAVGDGNHSLAAAKTNWEEVKSKLGSKAQLDPRRYALVEVVNIHCEGLPFHPIHRILMNANLAEFLNLLSTNFSVINNLSISKACSRVDSSKKNNETCVGLINGKQAKLLVLKRDDTRLASLIIQPMLSTYLKANSQASIDYIHGRESLIKLSEDKKNIGIYMPPVDKSSFFSFIKKEGIMPRKTFSMGEALDKRFYIEARSLKE